MDFHTSCEKSSYIPLNGQSTCNEMFDENCIHCNKACYGNYTYDGFCENCLKLRTKLDKIKTDFDFLSDHGCLKNDHDDPQYKKGLFLKIVFETNPADHFNYCSTPRYKIRTVYPVINSFTNDDIDHDGYVFDTNSDNMSVYRKSNSTTMACGNCESDVKYTIKTAQIIKKSDITTINDNENIMDDGEPQDQSQISQTETEGLYKEGWRIRIVFDTTTQNHHKDCSFMDNEIVTISPVHKKFTDDDIDLMGNVHDINSENMEIYRKFGIICVNCDSSVQFNIKSAQIISTKNVVDINDDN